MHLEVAKTFGTLEPALAVEGEADPVENTLISHMSPCQTRSRSNDTSVIAVIRRENLTHRVPPPFEVTQRLPNRHGTIATHDFLLVIHSNRGPISYRFRD